MEKESAKEVSTSEPERERERETEPQPVSPRKLPALNLQDVEKAPAAASSVLSPLSALVGSTKPPEKPRTQSQSLGAKRFSARIAKLKKKEASIKTSEQDDSKAVEEKVEKADPAPAPTFAEIESVAKPVSEGTSEPAPTPALSKSSVPAVDTPELKPERKLKFEESEDESTLRTEAGTSSDAAAKVSSLPEGASTIPQEMIYVWDENTGILKTVRERGSKIDTGPKTRYVEDAITGTFQKVSGKASLPKRAWGKASKRIRMSTNPLSLKLMYDTTSNIFGLMYLFMQGILGGMSLLSLYFFLLLDGSTPNGAFMRFYSPLSMAFSRMYFTLIVMSILGAYDKFHKDWMLQFEPVGPSQRTIDICLLALYLVALLCSVINTGYDDLLHYSYRRIPDWYDLELSSEFKDGYNLWYALSMIKIFCCALAWALVSFELRPTSITAISNK